MLKSELRAANVRFPFPITDLALTFHTGSVANLPLALALTESNAVHPTFRKLSGTSLSGAKKCWDSPKLTLSRRFFLTAKLGGRGSA